MLSAAQMSVLRYHAEAGDRIAYYTALADFGDEYGQLALEVVLNNTVSGASANSFFRDQTGGVTNGTLASVSLALMQADFLRRLELNGGDLTVDDIQRYHRDVFEDVAGATADAWTPNMYLDTFETLSGRQAAWELMLSSSAEQTAARIAARQTDVIQEYLDDNPTVTAPLGTLINSTLEELTSFGVSTTFAQWILD